MRKEVGSIVFGTIKENLKSFFSKEEEPVSKELPEPASDSLERPQKIVTRPLPDKPQLPFTPDQLRSALKEQAAKPPEPVRRRTEEVEEDISHEINAFESALTQVDRTSPRPLSEKAPAVEALKAPETNNGESPFFEEFEQFLLQEGLEVDGILDQDILHKMREFHKHRHEGTDYYLWSKDAKAAVRRQVQKLKKLEQEWFETRQRMDEVEHLLTRIEQEIESHSSDLKQLITQAKNKSRLERSVPEGKEFVLADGRKLKNLLELKRALRTMNDSMFQAHVSAEKNDFATWIKGSTGDEELASRMQELRDKQQFDTFLSRLAG